MLQWGRAQVSAEIGWGVAQRVTKQRASMGPRSGERGNAPTQVGAVALTLLQWGRAQVSAEMWKFQTARRPCDGLQWGRAQVSAEISGVFTHLRDQNVLQWGRAQVRAGIFQLKPRLRITV